MADKFKDILKAVSIGSKIAGPLLPGKIGSVLSAVTDMGGGNVDSQIATLAADNDEQTKAILALHARNNAQDADIKFLKSEIQKLKEGRQ